MQTLGQYMVAHQYHSDEWVISMKRGGSVLGTVKWFPKWKCFVFQPEEMTEFSPDCLQEISEFMSSLQLERKV